MQRLAGPKLAVDRVLVGVPGLRVAPKRMLGAQLADGRRGGEKLGRAAAAAPWAARCKAKKVPLGGEAALVV